VEPSLMVWMADLGQGRFYDVRAPGNLPQIFIKEAAVILKSAIFEEPFKPQVAAASEITRGIVAADYPPLKGYVATTPKTRAELPLLSEKSDPLLAHWQYGLGRAVAFTSDAKAKWATEWLAWPKYRQFWSQIAQWSLRKVDTGDFTAEIDIENSSGNIHVEALDSQGNFRNFLKLQAVIMNPDGERQNVPLEQTGPGRYEARFGGREVGAYLVNLQEMENGQVKSSQAFGASVNYSPEFNALGTHHPLLRRLTESGGGRLLDPDNPADNPFLHDRQKTHQPQDLWSLLLALAVILFPADVGIRRVQLDRGEWLKATHNFRRWLSFRRQAPRPLEADESLAALLARRSQTRAAHAPDPTLVGTLKSAAPPPAERKSSVTPAAVPTPPATPTPTAAAATTTDRLLEAKRRAQKRDS
jgi:Ca-activated chloride channel family protein